MPSVKKDTPGSRALQLAALLLTISLSAPAEETLGRLFLTPEQRQELDRLQAQNVQGRMPASSEATLTINGMVIRSSGKRTAWVNGKPLSETQMRDGLSITPESNGQVVIRGQQSSAARAKIGDTIDQHTGEAASLLRDGKIVIKPASGK